MQVEETTSIGTEAQVVANLTAQAIVANTSARPIQRTQEGGTPFVVLIGSDGSQRIEQLASFEPPRKKAKATFIERESFCEYVKEFGTADTRLFCDLAARSFSAVVDFHEATATPERGRRGEHVAVLTLKYTPAAEVWLKLVANPVSQATLAEFLEDRYNDITEPAGASILELAKTLEVKNNVAFKGSQRSSDGGYNLTYEEQVAAKAGVQGTMEIPSRFVVAIPVFQGGPTIELLVRLRFKLMSAGVVFTLTFLNFEERLRAEVELVRTLIADETARKVWAGTAMIG